MFLYVYTLKIEIIKHEYIYTYIVTCIYVVILMDKHWIEYLVNDWERFQDLILSNSLMTPILLNGQHGGFTLSSKVLQEYKLCESAPFCDIFSDRSDPILVSIVQKLGYKKSSGKHCSIYIQMVPTILLEHYSIFEYDGKENINEEHTLELFKLYVIRVLLKSNIESTILTNRLNWLDMLMIKSKCDNSNGNDNYIMIHNVCLKEN